VRLGAVHGSCSSPAEPDSDAATRLGFTSALRRQTDREKVELLKSRLS